MCFSSTCAMAIKYLRPDALKGSNADDDYLRTVLKYGDTTEYPAQIKACQQYGVISFFSKAGNKEKLLNELKSGYPVAVGILHRGPASSPRGGGHWMLLIGDEGTHGVFMDPYGRMNNLDGGYVSVGSGGKDVRYDWANWMKRWAVEGPNTGWYMTFRPAPKQVTNSWQGVKTAAQECGAKFPEVVAAQWALESAYGKHTSGVNNFFGIKADTPGIGTLVRTTEFIKGKEVKVEAWFKDFGTLYGCVNELVTRWYKDYKGYKGVNRATSAEECAKLLVVEGYATDPNYASKLISIIKEND